MGWVKHGVGFCEATEGVTDSTLHVHLSAAFILVDGNPHTARAKSRLMNKARERGAFQLGVVPFSAQDWCSLSLPPLEFHNIITYCLQTIVSSSGARKFVVCTSTLCG